jgi:hypothetical protein
MERYVYTKERRNGATREKTPYRAIEFWNEAYVFQRDVMFSSPSAAAGVVVGASANGWVCWKNKDGKTLDELVRQQ